MKNPIKRPVPLIASVIVLTGLTVVALRQGSIREYKNHHRSNSANSIRNHSNSKDGGKLSVRQNELTYYGTTRPPAVERPLDADGSIMARAEGRSQTAGDAKPQGSHGNLRSILAETKFTAHQKVLGIESFRSSGELDDDSIQAALDYLKNTMQPEGISLGQHHWIIDELVTTLRTNGTNNAELSQVLAGIYRDRSRDPVIRDYVLQHLGHMRVEGGDAETIAQTLGSATLEKEGTIAGTALLALGEKYGAEPIQRRNSASALTIVNDTSYDLRSRITAMQVAGQQGDWEALPVAAKTAADASQPVALRMAAIATLADLGAKDQVNLMESLSNSTDPRLRSAARAAFSKLNLE